MQRQTHHRGQAIHWQHEEAPCPTCGSRDWESEGFTRDGATRLWQCHECGDIVADLDDDRPGCTVAEAIAANAAEWAR